jgi:hypothetical protein
MNSAAEPAAIVRRMRRVRARIAASRLVPAARARARSSAEEPRAPDEATRVVAGE